jgi:predicted AlkP superfamily pyrophosphatase or phosphodiesterase
VPKDSPLQLNCDSIREDADVAHVARFDPKLSRFFPGGRWALAAAALALGCLGTSRARPAEPAPILLVSLDGFRWDYAQRHSTEAAHLRAYAAEGISASELIPVYPSNTFPNHYTIVTGLYPAHHGIINNDFSDPGSGRVFHYSLMADSLDSSWWGGEPIWVTAVKQGRKSASSYWVGAEAAIEGVRPTYYKHFDMAEYMTAPFSRRIDEVVGWLKKTAEQRPAVVTFYMEETNGAGHQHGVDSPELAAAVKLVDGRLGELMDRLRAEHLPVNLLVVSDHGMTPVSAQRVLLLDDYVDLKTVEVDFQSPAMGLRVLHGSAQDLVHTLSCLPPAKVYLAASLPARWHLTANPRIPDVWIAPELGWHVQTRAFSQVPSVHAQVGDHGFDPAYRDMHGILVADGPAFKTGGQVIGPVANIHIYNLMCAVLHLQPAPNDGDDRLVRAFLR